MTRRAAVLAAVAWATSALAALPPPELLPRSSIAAVLGHRGELGLTEAEVARLEALDDALANERIELRKAAGPAGRGGEAAPAREARDGKQAEDGGGAGSEPRMGGRGGPGMGGRPGGGMGGRGAAPGGGHRAAERGASEDALRSRLDDADTRAYLRAEEVLAPGQRDRAREIASEYRAALYDARDGQKRGAAR
ncbi:hypothetical protein [Anaeromyxobacter oryzae]|uniref:Uncharacterized protein n=1 Tax=Anaeromyxobacter oryzae TaxID=2918170 RepID=A0ABM7WS08_9BACT|nr:hypothetical protein [Anaeromyxobacter oryzae]BDG02266.1 hypothetical protein AMOR_12620 [Anaeromyxobacter oryzae]